MLHSFRLLAALALSFSLLTPALAQSAPVTVPLPRPQPATPAKKPPLQLPFRLTVTEKHSVKGWRYESKMQRYLSVIEGAHWQEVHEVNTTRPPNVNSLVKNLRAAHLPHCFLGEIGSREVVLTKLKKLGFTAKLRLTPQVPDDKPVQGNIYTYFSTPTGAGEALMRFNTEALENESTCMTITSILPDGTRMLTRITEN